MIHRTKSFGQKEALKALKPTVSPRPAKCYLENRKSSPRSRQFKNVKIIFNNGFCTYDAILRDISKSGVRIETKHVVDIPNIFTLQFTNDNTTKNCHLIWRDKEFIGARFISFPHDTTDNAHL